MPQAFRAGAGGGGLPGGRGVTLRVMPIAIIGIGALALGASLLLLQDAIARAALSPKTPYQIASKPPNPDYEAADRSAWVLWPESQSGGAEIFYVHSTTHYSRAAWNGSTLDPASDAILKRLAVPNQAGPFLDAGRLFGPRYRQATLFAAFTHKFDGVAARLLAYEDVKTAFAVFLENADPARPIVLAGYEQGGLHVLGLLQDYFQTNDALRKRLAAAYVIEQATPLSMFETNLAKTPPCESPDAVRCVVSYVDVEARFPREIERARDRSMAWTGKNTLRATRGEPLLCLNPLTWTNTTDRIGAERHLGAASATGVLFGRTPPKVANAVGAQCVDGILKVDRPQQDYLRRSDWMGLKWRAQHFNLFYFDLAADARRRVDTAALTMEAERQILDPIDQSIDIQDSPIKKVPR